MPKFRSTTRPAVDPPPAVNHIYAPSRTGPILVLSLVIVITVLIVYYWLMSTLQDLGLDGDIFLLQMIGWILAVASFAWFGSRLFNYIANGINERQLARDEIHLDKLRLQLEMMQAVSVDVRETDPTLKKRNALITAVVTDAIAGQYNFSYKKMGEYVIDNEKVGKGSKAVDDARRWLYDNNAWAGNPPKWTGKYNALPQLQIDLHTPILHNSKASSSSSGQDDA